MLEEGHVQIMQGTKSGLEMDIADLDQIQIYNDEKLFIYYLQQGYQSWSF